MITAAHRTCKVEDLDTGTTILTPKGPIIVESVTRTATECKVSGEPVGRKAKRAVVTFPRLTDVTIPAGPADLDRIEAAFYRAVDNSGIVETGVVLGVVTGYFTANVDGENWYIRRRGEATDGE